LKLPEALTTVRVRINHHNHVKGAQEHLLLDPCMSCVSS
jgi:hypothetical protein